VYIFRCIHICCCHNFANNIFWEKELGIFKFSFWPITLRKGESLLCNSVTDNGNFIRLSSPSSIILTAACYRLRIIVTFFFIIRFRFTGTNITAYRKSFFMLTFITKLSLNLTVLKNPPRNIIVTYTLNPCHIPTSTTTRIQCMVTYSRQNTWSAKKQKEYNLRYLLESVGQAPAVEQANKRSNKKTVSDEIRCRIQRG
jgi:hypothetical protein